MNNDSINHIILSHQRLLVERELRLLERKILSNCEEVSCGFLEAKNGQLLSALDEWHTLFEQPPNSNANIRGLDLCMNGSGKTASSLDHSYNLYHRVHVLVAAGEIVAVGIKTVLESVDFLDLLIDIEDNFIERKEWQLKKYDLLLIDLDEYTDSTLSLDIVLSQIRNIFPWLRIAAIGNHPGLISQATLAGVTTIASKGLTKQVLLELVKQALQPFNTQFSYYEGIRNIINQCLQSDNLLKNISSLNSVKRNEEMAAFLKNVGAVISKIAADQLDHQQKSGSTLFNSTAIQLGQRLREFRHRCCINRQQLAKEAGVDLATIVLLENGVLPDEAILTETLHKLAQVLSVSIKDFSKQLVEGGSSALFSSDNQQSSKIEETLNGYIDNQVLDQIIRQAVEEGDISETEADDLWRELEDMFQIDTMAPPTLEGSDNYLVVYDEAQDLVDAWGEMDDPLLSRLRTSFLEDEVSGTTIDERAAAILQTDYILADVLAEVNDILDTAQVKRYIVQRESPNKSVDSKIEPMREDFLSTIIDYCQQSLTMCLTIDNWLLLHRSHHNSDRISSDLAQVVRAQKYLQKALIIFTEIEKSASVPSR